MEIYDYSIFNIRQFLSKLAAQPRQRISNIYIYLYGSYQSELYWSRDENGANFRMAPLD